MSDQVQSDAIETPAVLSVSVEIRPVDSRCRHWAKVVRAGQELPIPADVDGASDIPGGYARNGDEELFEGDVLIEGEENHHRKARGWTYYITYMNKNGDARRVKPSSEIKSYLKQQGLDPRLLAGSGDVAACVRIAHAIRAGFRLEPAKHQE